MERDVQLPKVINNGNYCGYYGKVIVGTKRKHPRGWEYDLVVILDDENLVFGHEEGNYAGGIMLEPNSENYIFYRNRKMEKIKKYDVDFYNLILKELYGE